MIQRIQTVYFLLVICLMAVLWFIPVTVLHKPELIGIAILALTAIFLFKNRKRQILLGYIILLALLLDYVAFFVWKFDPAVFASGIVTFLIPFVAGVFDFLAIRGIRKDEKLVRSLDRLR
ncbi:membrane protein [Bacteroidia bacterium]|nr:membrane protein [Bacteroidia bacterium]GHT28796.1 membrane protein [Bacteroidia bacterium]GHT83910.1 membrane protein [Bacteroidia bacterium]